MKFFYHALAYVSFCLVVLRPHVFAQEPGDAAVNLLNLDLEALMQIPIISAPGFSSHPRDIPAAVTIISAADIRIYGWQTLADILNTLPGFSISNDHTYSFAAVRGLAVSGDWRSRMKVLINGIGVNENIYDSTTIDTAFPINLAQIDHIEIIRGPSASVYGSNSMFGVINIVTRSGNDIQGLELSTLTGSGHFQRQNALWGRTFGEMDIMLAGSVFDANGSTLIFPELTAANLPATASGVGAEQGYNFTSRVLYQNWRFSLHLSNREKIVPTGTYGTVINDTKHFERDANRLVELGYLVKSGTRFSWDSRLYHGNYKYDGQYPYDQGPEYVLNQENTNGSWWGYESAITTKLGNRHNVIAGFTYKDNYRQSMENVDLGYTCEMTGAHICFQSLTQSENISLYLQDDIQLLANTRMTLGWRLDKRTDQTSQNSPRLGLIHRFGNWGSVKYLYAEAFRNPNPYERFYTVPGYYANPDLKPEAMQSSELTWEKSITPNQQLVLTYYQYELNDFIFSEADMPPTNSFGFESEGVEAILSGKFPSDFAYTVSLTHQSTRNQTAPVVQNSPAYLFKVNLTFPTPVNGLISAVEFRSVTHRHTFLEEGKIAGYGVANLIFNYQAPASRWNIKSGIKDILDREYDDPVAKESYMTILRDRMPQLGRTWFAELGYKY